MQLGFLILIICGSLFGPIYSILAGNATSILLTCIISLLITVFGWLCWRYPKQKVFKALIAAIFGISMPVFYGATGIIIKKLQKPHLDAEILKLEQYLFPNTHISFWLDENPWIGPSSIAGKLITEVLQTAYFSYYIWGYFLLFFLISSFLKNPQAWAKLQRFLCAWIGAYYINFIFYILIPVIGPQFYFEGQYTNDLNGFGLAGKLRAFIAENQATVEDCFPSGHTALSWITAIIALRYTAVYGKIATIAAVLITLATVYLRFHYVVDLIAAIPLILIGLYWGDFLGKNKGEQIS